MAASEANTPPTRSLTVHSFTPRASDVQRFADELTATVREKSQGVPGLLRVLVLREGSGVTLLGEWDSPESEIAGAAEMYRQHVLTAAAMSGTRPSELHHYTVLAIIEAQG